MVLSANDLVAGLTTGPLFALHLAREVLGTQDCTGATITAISLHTTAISSTTFLILNFEIYLSVVHPIFHKTKITNGRILIVLIVLWLLQVLRVYPLLYYMGASSAPLVSVIVTLALLCLAFLHGRIFVTVYKRRRIGVVNNDGTTSVNFGRFKSILAGARDAKSCLLITFLTTVCYLPVVIDNGIKSENPVRTIVLNPWSSTFILSASVLNSIVFYWRNKILRKEAMTILRDLCIL